MNDEDRDNPAVSRLQTMPPALVEAIGVDPKNAEKFARQLAALNLDKMWHKYGSDPELSLSGRIELQRLLNRMGSLEPKPNAEGAAASGFVFTINFQEGASPISFSGAPVRPAIEAEATVVDADDE